LREGKEASVIEENPKNPFLTGEVLEQFEIRKALEQSLS
jgi:hypothetical protein